MVSGSLALLLCCFEVAEGSRAAAPRGDEVLQNGEKFRTSVRPTACPSMGLSKGSEGQVEGSEGQPEESEGFEGPLEGSEGQPEGSEGQLEGSEGQPVGAKDVCISCMWLGRVSNKSPQGQASALIRQDRLLPHIERDQKYLLKMAQK